jgi:hypothetical protein
MLLTCAIGCSGSKPRQHWLVSKTERRPATSQEEDFASWSFAVNGRMRVSDAVLQETIIAKVWSLRVALGVDEKTRRSASGRTVYLLKFDGSTKGYSAIG